VARREKRYSSSVGGGIDGLFFATGEGEGRERNRAVSKNLLRGGDPKKLREKEKRGLQKVLFTGGNPPSRGRRGTLFLRQSI